MKKFSILLLIFILIVSLCACGKKADDSVFKDASRLTQGSSSKETSADDDSPEKTDDEIGGEEESSTPSNSSSKTNSNVSSKKPASQAEQTTNSKKEEAQKPTPQQLIHGSWDGEIDMTDFFAAQGMTADRTLFLTFNMTFFPGGSYTEFVYADSYKKLMWDVFNAEIAKSGMSKAEFEAAYEQQTGMTLSAYIDSVVQSTVNDFVTDYHYKFEGDKLYYKEIAAPETEYKEMGYRFSDDGSMVEFTKDGQKVLFYRE